MRTLQLLTLALIATAARADLASSFDGSIVGQLADGTPYSQTGYCGNFVEAAFTSCSGTGGDGQVSITMAAAGSGFDNGPQLHATASGTFSLTDTITIYDMFGTKQEATVVWDTTSQQLDENTYFAMDMPSSFTFGVPFQITIGMGGAVAANTGEDQQSAYGSIAVTGFQVFGASCKAVFYPAGSQYDPASCGDPLFSMIDTQSGFLYGGNPVGGFAADGDVPEPASIWLLATVVVMAWLVAGLRHWSVNLRLSNNRDNK